MDITFLRVDGFGSKLLHMTTIYIPTICWELIFRFRFHQCGKRLPVCFWHLFVQIWRDQSRQVMLVGCGCPLPYGMMHDAWQHLQVAGYQELCRPDVSRGALCSFLGSPKLRWRNLRWAEYQIRRCKLPDNYLHQDLPENEPAIISTAKECTAVEDRVTERNSKAAVRNLILTVLPSLTHFCDQKLPEIELVQIASTTKECTSVEDRVMETNSKAAVRGLIHIVKSPAISDAHLNPEIVWKSPGGRSLNSTVFHGCRERGIKGVAVCSSFHTSSIDTRGSWSCSQNHGSMRRAMRGL